MYKNNEVSFKNIENSYAIDKCSDTVVETYKKLQSYSARASPKNE